mmetsp:Transcript_110997/g.318942  ORF Transcript_110997/g.318942 Transcript_110997/m.318942 type:complete len:308 (+) Transcript_110997:118-1041(+)
MFTVEGEQCVVPRQQVVVRVRGVHGIENVFHFQGLQDLEAFQGLRGVQRSEADPGRHRAVRGPRWPMATSGRRHGDRGYSRSHDSFSGRQRLAHGLYRCRPVLRRVRRSEERGYGCRQSDQVGRRRHLAKVAGPGRRDRGCDDHDAVDDVRGSDLGQVEWHMEGWRRRREVLQDPEWRSRARGWHRDPHCCGRRRHDFIRRRLRKRKPSAWNDFEQRRDRVGQWRSLEPRTGRSQVQRPGDRHQDAQPSPWWCQRWLDGCRGRAGEVGGRAGGGRASPGGTRNPGRDDRRLAAGGRALQVAGRAGRS